ncbi:uncharacterized protein isoform X3 [Rhodnius prolixus]|uniref:uncharacterized protein isoform X3 n=1 Tax=Rhodnius prolixus TaxID=13249 RepID=UPI003D18F6DE
MKFRVPKEVLVLASAVISCLADDDFDFASNYKRPPPAILMHKQALRQDGAFNFVFAAENGLKQGETIAPDGTRTGAYSYVDPNGQTISVKYTAGKDGFKIIEGNHVPTAPPHLAAQPSQQPYQEFQPYQQARSSYNSEEYEPVPVYGPNAPNDLSGPTSSDHRSAIPVYERPEPPTFRAPMHRPKQINQYVPRPEDQHKGPHSFGKGYSFEFSG